MNAPGLSSIIDNPPQCILDACSTPGITSIHVYVDNYLVDCTEKADSDVARGDRPRGPVLPGEIGYQ